MRFIRKKSKCSECPLRGSPRVASEGSFTTGVILIGESPGEEEVINGRPFIGPAGNELMVCLNKAGLSRDSVYLMNLISCRPPKNELSSFEGKEALECCRSGYEEEICFVRKQGAKVFLPLGNEPMNNCGISGGVTTRRGFVEKSHFELPTIPSYHPSFIIRGNFHLRPVAIADFQKAKRIAAEGYKAPVERFNLNPTVDDVKKFVSKALKKKSLVAVDIETSGLVPSKAKILMVGLAVSSEEALVVPFYKQYGARYWKSAEEETEIKSWLSELFLKCPTAFQNASFDVAMLQYHGYIFGDIRDDTLLLHHCLHPELPHNLGFITAEWTDLPYWKGTLKNKESVSTDLDDSEFRTYNARDCVALHMILPQMRDYAKKMGVLSVYEDIAIPLIQPVVDMILKGVHLDKKALTKWNLDMAKKVEDLEKELRKEYSLPEAFNLNSLEHIRYILYGKIPKQFENSLKVVRTKKKGSKVHDKAEGIAAIPVLLKPLYIPITLVGKIQKGKLDSVDDESLRTFIIECEKRIEDLKALKRVATEKQVAEKAAIEKTLLFVLKLKELRKYAKLVSTYSFKNKDGAFVTWDDGRVHFPYKMTGTATGRLSSGDKKGTEVGNAQNIPKAARHVFTAEEGNTLISADYSNLEMRVIAYLSGDEALLKMFKEGKKPHTENVKLFFGIGEDHPDFEKKKKSAKGYIFGMNYGGSLPGIHKKLLLKEPDCGITLEQFKQIHNKYLSHHPAYSNWRNETQAFVARTRFIKNGFGRIRYFLGAADDVQRECLNTPVQSTAADIMNISMIRVHKKLKEEYENAGIIFQVHDAIVIEAKKEDAKKIEKMLHEEMEGPFKINGYEAIFPVDIVVSEKWQ